MLTLQNKTQCYCFPFFMVSVLKIDKYWLRHWTKLSPLTMTHFYSIWTCCRYIWVMDLQNSMTQMEKSDHYYKYYLVAPPTYVCVCVCTHMRVMHWPELISPALCSPCMPALASQQQSTTCKWLAKYDHLKTELQRFGLSNNSSFKKWLFYHQEPNYLQFGNRVFV